MIKFVLRNFYLVLLFAFFQFAGADSTLAADAFEKLASSPPPQSVSSDDIEKNAIAETTRMVEELIEKSYPELRTARISVITFDSRSDYFRSRFSFRRFLTFRELHFLICVNPQIFEKNAPTNGIRAIIAHELAHASYYGRHKRYELFGLVALRSKSFTTRFERGADLQALKRGYGSGLKEYREWLYQNIPNNQIITKKRDYFSPEEIDLIIEAIKAKPGLIDFWIKNVPRNMAEIEAAIKNRTPDGK